MTPQWHEVVAVTCRRARPSTRRSAATALGHGLSTALFSLIHLVVILPMSAMSLLGRVRRPGLEGRWEPNAPSSPRRVRSQVIARPRTRPEAPRSRAHRLAPLIPVLVGWLVIAGAIDLGVGVAWNAVAGRDEDTASLTPWAPATELAGRAAFEDEPWVLANLRAYEQIEYRYEPFLMEVMTDREGAGLVIADGVRRSCICGADEDDPEVWFLGGSTTFGPGQRDSQTVPSQVARLAAAAGAPIQATNLANPGYSSFQEWQLLERRLAAGARPDLVVFIDGVADVAVQRESPTDGPSHFNRDGTAAAMRGEEVTRDSARSLWDRYLETSLLRRLTGQITGVAEAAEPSATNGGRAAEVYARAQQLAVEVADTYGTSALFVWEPAPVAGPLVEDYRHATDLLPPDVVDLSAAFDGATDLHFDWFHVNERGASRLAAELYPLVLHTLREP